MTVLGYIIVAVVIGYGLLRAWLFVVSLFPSNQVRSNHGINRETGPQVASTEADQGADAGSALDEARAILAQSHARLTAAAEAACPALEEKEDDATFLGRKAAFLVRLPDGSYGFRSAVYFGHVYGVDATAECHVSVTTHAAPADRCKCGFYAVPPDLKIPLPATLEDQFPCLVTLLVELGGEAIEHETGYRAQYQMVVEVQLPPCVGCGEPAEWVGFTDELASRFRCAAHRFNVKGSGVPRAELAAALGVEVTA